MTELILYFMLSQFVMLLVCPKCSINIFNASDEKYVEHASLLVFVSVCYKGLTVSSF